MMHGDAKLIIRNSLMQGRNGASCFTARSQVWMMAIETGIGITSDSISEWRFTQNLVEQLIIFVSQSLLRRQ